MRLLPRCTLTSCPGRRSGRRSLGIRWVAANNYTVEFPRPPQIAERVLWPHGPTELQGMEDARFVRFVDDDGAVTYFATYTAFDQALIAPQLLTTTDFATFGVSQLSGPSRPTRAWRCSRGRSAAGIWPCRAGTASTWPSPCPTTGANGPRPPPWCSPPTVGAGPGGQLRVTARDP